jgi:hypothetical protein
MYVCIYIYKLASLRFKLNKLYLLLYRWRSTAKTCGKEDCIIFVYVLCVCKLLVFTATTTTTTTITTTSTTTTTTNNNNRTIWHGMNNIKIKRNILILCCSRYKEDACHG